MGTVRKYSKHRAWTLEEINRLERMCEKGLPQETIAQSLGRTVASVKSKRIALDLPGMKDSLDRLTMTDISILCGVSKDSVNKTWVRRGLATRKYGGVRHTSEKILFDFMKNNTDLWNAADCDKYFFQNQKWFADKLKSERTDGEKRKTYEFWTEYEKARIRMLWQRGFFYREISVKMGRSFQSVYLYINRNLKDGDANEKTVAAK